MRLIDADEVVRLIQARYECPEICKREIDAIPTIDPVKWISVSEILPEIKQAVLCIGKKGTIHVAKNWIDWEDGSVSFDVPDLGCWLKCNYWMPLPDSPRMDDEA